MKMTKKQKEAFKKVKLLLLDVDGVLTRGEIIYDNAGRELKIFNVKDGLGIYLLSKFAVPVVIITAKDSPVVRRRAHDMRIDKVIGGELPKAKMIPQLLKKYKVKKDEICFVGDDLIDIGIMNIVGVPVAVHDALPEVKKAALYVSRYNGGQGAVREVVECILKAKNKWAGLIKNFDSIVKK
ncbi:MAG: HAD-IIIA family hydrolase [Candidatus Omnitrophica bacterium]|nr:HAD-IIIA family hydrolase [Candidatus Omnitrophota bacterium]